MRFVRAYGRLLVFVLTISMGMLLIGVLTLCLGRDIRRSMKIRRTWLQLIGRVMGLQDELSGVSYNQTCLYVSNHRSFTDPMVALKHIDAFPLAKAEVNQYPLIGLGARLTGILYVVRDNAASRNGAKTAMRETLEGAGSVLIYPEGTTTTDPTSASFKKGSFEVAVHLGIPIVPIAIEYEDPADHWSDTSLIHQYLQQFGKAKCMCKIAIGPPIEVKEDPLHALEQTQTWIDSQLKDFRREFG